MKNKTFTHVSKASFALVVLLALQSLLIGVGANTTATPAIQKSLPDLRSELATIERYHDALVAYNNLCSQLARRSALRQGDIDPAQRKASELSGGLSGVQSAIRQIIDKFKAANAWNDLDEKLAANADAKLRPFLQGSSFRKDLEDAAAGLGGQHFLHFLHAHTHGVVFVHAVGELDGALGELGHGPRGREQAARHQGCGHQGSTK